MARKNVFDKEKILSKAKDYLMKNDIETLNARSLCSYIGCSTQPLFKYFANMSELKSELKDYLHDYYNSFVEQRLNKEDYLYSISNAYATFSFENSNLFKALFMSDLAGTRTISEVLSSAQNQETIAFIEDTYNFSKKQANELYRDTRLYVHGLSCQIATNSISVSQKEISFLIENIITKLKEGIINENNH